MHPKPDFTIHLLKERLSTLEKALEMRNILLPKRDDIEKAIRKMKQEILKVNKELLNELKQKLIDIDHALDESEELSQEDIDQAKTELINCILDHHPDQTALQRERITELKNIEELEKWIEILKSQFLTIQHVLQAIIATRESIKGKGLLNYIFGMSPNAIIERQLLESSRLTQTSISFLDSFLKKDLSAEHPQIFYALRDFLTSLLKNLKGTWGFSHIDTKIKAANEKLADYLIALRSYTEEMNLKKALLENQLKNWLEQW